MPATRAATTKVHRAGAGSFDTFFGNLQRYQLPRLAALGITPGPAFPEGWTQEGYPPWHVRNGAAGEEGAGRGRRLREIRLRTGDLVDQFEFVYCDGSAVTHGNNRARDGGAPQVVGRLPLICMYVCMCMYACMHVCMYACMYVRVCVCVCMYACMHVCMYVGRCVCMYACMYE